MRIADGHFGRDPAAKPAADYRDVIEMKLCNQIEIEISEIVDTVDPLRQGRPAESRMRRRNDADVAEWRRISSLVHDHSPAKLGLLVNSAAASEELVHTARRADEAGFDVLELSDPGSTLGRDLLTSEADGLPRADRSSPLILVALSSVREVWPGRSPEARS